MMVVFAQFRELLCNICAKFVHHTEFHMGAAQFLTPATSPACGAL